MKTNLIEHFSVGLIFLLAVSARGQGTFVYDQQSADESTGGGVAFTIQSNQPIGQSFVPTFSSVGFIRLFLIDRTLNNLGATVYVNLRSDSITGNILASTDPVFMPDGFGGYPNFFFSTPVQVTPGVTYFFQPVVQSGDSWAVVGYHYNYPGGTAFLHGSAFSSSDLWFREGVVVPEPSSVLLILLGAGVLVWLLGVKTKGKNNESDSHI